MIAHPDIDPTAFYIFGWPVRWYGLMYLLAFAAAFAWGRRLLRRAAFADLRRLVMDDMLLAGVIGVVAGGRLGYVLFYNPAFYAENPGQIPRLWDGGMSFHGGLLGVAVALFLYARRGGLPFLRTTDFAAMLAPIGLGLGRIGNFINGELPGRVAPPDLPWAMIFPGDSVARHPSPLYQAFLEGALLFAVLLFFSARRRPPGFLSGVFLTGYALSRIVSELFREPDAHLGFIFGGFSMGQLLSVPMLLGGVALLCMDKWTPAARRAYARLFSPAKKNNAAAANSADAKNAPETSAADLRDDPQPVADAAESAEDLQTAAADSAEIDGDSVAPEEEVEETEEDDKNGADLPAAAARSAPWWKKIFAKTAAEKTESPVRRRTRREVRRGKKKKRRR